MPVLHNPRHEKFSQLVASGIKPKEAYTSVGYKPTGAKQAASRLLTNVDVRERVSELQEAAARSAAECVILSRERVLNRLSQLSHEAQQRGHYSAAARCEELIGKEIGMFVFVDRTAFLWETDPEKLSDRQLQVLGDYLVKKAEEESRLQVAAGTRVIDAQSTAIEST
ncbi:MAG TPA: terminase small subunit [Bryobacteraceae bacterium]|nr:terminase small subunit [Bryobacteraceae bacterium]